MNEQQNYLPIIILSTAVKHVLTYRVNKKYTPIFQLNMHSVAPVCVPINAQVH